MIFAPFEADSQLAYLYRNDIIDGIITEDSDLLVYVFKNNYLLFRDATYY